jgi:hypothetical protein
MKRKTPLNQETDEWLPDGSFPFMADANVYAGCLGCGGKPQPIMTSWTRTTEKHYHVIQGSINCQCGTVSEYGGRIEVKVTLKARRIGGKQ